jgi:hypothetical protein
MNLDNRFGSPYHEFQAMRRQAPDVHVAGSFNPLSEVMDPMTPK